MKRSPKTTRKRGVKRDLFKELTEGMDALADARHGKRMLRTLSLEVQSARPTSSASYITPRKPCPENSGS